MSSSPIRMLVVGAGAFGLHHLRVLSELPGVTLAGIYDTDSARADQAAQQYGCPSWPSLQAASGEADAAIVAVPTAAHTDVGCALLEAGLDVLVEKPIAFDLASARKLNEAAQARGRILQVGHLERFNPAVQALSGIVSRPLFFEIHRLSMFSPRSLDIDVVLDLMIHDIDILLALTGELPTEIRACGLPVLTGRVDIANVRLAFPGGCIANLTASRVSTERVRKLRLFQPHQYISLDYAAQQCVAFTVSPEGGPALSEAAGIERICFAPLPVEKGEPLQKELAAFAGCIRNRRAPVVGGVEGIRALEVSLAILDKIKEHLSVVMEAIEPSSRAAPRLPGV